MWDSPHWILGGIRTGCRDETKPWVCKWVCKWSHISTSVANCNEVGTIRWPPGSEVTQGAPPPSPSSPLDQLERSKRRWQNRSNPLKNHQRILGDESWVTFEPVSVTWLRSSSVKNSICYWAASPPCCDIHRSRSHSQISEQFQSNIRAISEQFQSNSGAITMILVKIQRRSIEEDWNRVGRRDKCDNGAR